MNALPYNLRVNTKVSFPSLVAGASGIKITKVNGIWTVKLDFTSFQQLATIPDPANTYVVGYNILTGAALLVQVGAIANSKSIKTITSGATYAAQPSDEVLLLKNAPMTITVDWAARTKALRVVDQTGTASVNNITITPAAGQTQMGQANYSYVIDGNGGSITLTPLPDGSGAY